MRRILLVGSLLLSTTAWAATTLETTKEVKAGRLTDEMKALVPALEGLDVDVEKQPNTTLLTIRRLTGEFSTAEVTLLQQALTAHDAMKVPVDPNMELEAAITGATTLQELKDALLGKTKAGRVAGRTP